MIARRDGRTLTAVTQDADGRPVAFALPAGPATQTLHVLQVLDHWREWIGILDGEPERDIWRVETDTGGICELHHLRPPTTAEADPPTATWLLHGWED